MSADRRRKRRRLLPAERELIASGRWNVAYPSGAICCGSLWGLPIKDRQRRAFAALGRTESASAKGNQP